MAPVLELAGIQKHFGSVHALRGADFVLAQGEIQALLGENGAGKTTLMHVAYGLMRPDRGIVKVNGSPRIIASPRESRKLGIGMVHQHFTAIPALTVAENIALSAGWAGEPRDLSNRAQSVSEELGLPLRAQSYTRKTCAQRNTRERTLERDGTGKDPPERATAGQKRKPWHRLARLTPQFT